MFLEVSHAPGLPVSRVGLGLSASKFFGTHVNTLRHTTTKFSTVIKLDARKMFTGSTTPQSSVRKFCDTIADA